MNIKERFFVSCLFMLMMAALPLLSSEVYNPQSCKVQTLKQINEPNNIRIIDTFLQRKVSGMDASYREVFDAINAKGHQTFIIGGTLRDLLLDEPEDPSDIDFIYTCTADELEAILIEHKWIYTRLPGGNVIDIGTLDGQYMQGVPSFYSDPNDVNQQDFTINRLVYDTKKHRFLDESQGGYEDLQQKQLRVVSKDWVKWLDGNPNHKRKNKIFRFWRMVAKGYSYSREFEKFIIDETNAIQKNEPELLIDEMIRYFSGHIDSYEEALTGSKIIMGREWTEKNFSVFYQEFVFQNQLKRKDFANFTYFKPACSESVSG